MGKAKISELASAAALDGTESVPMVQGGVTVIATSSDIAALGGGGGSGVTALAVASIADPSTELNAISGSANGDLRLCYQAAAAADIWTLYAWDSADSDVESVPYTVDGLTGRWAAIAGSYIDQAQSLAGILSLGSGLVVGGNTLSDSLLTADGASSSDLAIATAGWVTANFSSTTGDVAGPASATDNAIARFDSTTGKLLQNSGVTISDAGAIEVTVGTTALPGLAFQGALYTGINASATTLHLISGANLSAQVTSNSIGIKAVVQSATIPAWYKITDTNTGTFWPAADTFAVTTGGTEAARWDASQKMLCAGEVEIDGALNHDGTTAGFYGAAPVAQQTGVAVTAAGIHAALVNLGLITA